MRLGVGEMKTRYVRGRLEHQRPGHIPRVQHFFVCAGVCGIRFDPLVEARFDFGILFGSPANRKPDRCHCDEIRRDCPIRAGGIGS